MSRLVTIFIIKYIVSFDVEYRNRSCHCISFNCLTNSSQIASYECLIFIETSFDIV